MTFTPEQEQFMQLQMTYAYHEGMRDGVHMYAYWQDGTQYVGTTGRTLQQALDSINLAEEDMLTRCEKLAQV